MTDQCEYDFCPEHGPWYAKGCEQCARDLDYMQGPCPTPDEPIPYRITEAGRKILEGE